jgi:ketosteroid isomerase-like protein
MGGGERLPWLVLLFALSGGTPSGATAPNATTDGEVASAVATFLTAFENLDWKTFSAAFADDVTAFFPIPEPPQRFEGRAAVEAQFRRVFQKIHETAMDGPPYQRLQPENLSIQRLGPSLALVSFELRNAERVGRRSLILRKQDGNWKIVHLHASNVLLKQ